MSLLAKERANRKMKFDLAVLSVCSTLSLGVLVFLLCLSIKIIEQSNLHSKTSMLKTRTCKQTHLQADTHTHTHTHTCEADTESRQTQTDAEYNYRLIENIIKK